MCCAEELRISESKVKLGKSFLSLGKSPILCIAPDPMANDMGS